MCCCGSTNVNGQPGYRWQPNDTPSSTRPVAAPPVDISDGLIFDEPGRCGGLDAHSHHFRVTSRGDLLWRHGGGTGRMRLSGASMVLVALGALDSNSRYWLLHALYEARADGERDGTERTASRYVLAACEKRLKVSRRGGRVTARIVEPTT
jgi:hypothetical protein